SSGHQLPWLFVVCQRRSGPNAERSTSTTQHEHLARASLQLGKMAKGDDLSTIALDNFRLQLSDSLTRPLPQFLGSVLRPVPRSTPCRAQARARRRSAAAAPAAAAVHPPGSA